MYYFIKSKDLLLRQVWLLQSIQVKWFHLRVPLAHGPGLFGQGFRCDERLLQLFWLPCHLDFLLYNSIDLHYLA